MTSATIWNRIEPRVRSDSLSSLDARIYDPLWLLARQWQVGEFAAEDAGSPIAVTLQGSIGLLSHVALGAARPGEAYSPSAEPLEAVIESEPAGALDLRASARAGLEWWAELDRAGLGNYRQEYLTLYPLPAVPAGADAASRRTAGVLGGRVCDGLAVATALATALQAGSLPTTPAFPAGEQAAATAAAKAFVARVGAESPTPGTAPPAAGTAPPARGAPPAAWAGTRLEYSAAVAAQLGGREHALIAPEHRGGPLDWSAFDVDSAGGVIPPGRRPPRGSPTVPAEALFPRSFQPQPARFAGMPRARYWEFEDGNVNFGSVETGPTDLTRLLLLEYALVYGNDYFVVPLSLPLGSVCEIDAVIVADTFGGTWSLPSVASVDGAAGGFRLFTHTDPNAGTPAAAQALLVPPTARTARAGRPLERVRYLRDDPAEMAWGIEETVQGGSGRPIQRSELDREQAQAAREQNPPPAAAATALTYRLITPPPTWWVPLVPEQTSSTAFALRAREPVDAGGAPQAPLGRILVPGALLADEEVPRSGIDAERVARRGRWLGGRTATWVGRRVRPGRVEGSSPLTWDSVDPLT